MRYICPEGHLLNLKQYKEQKYHLSKKSPSIFCPVCKCYWKKKYWKIDKPLDWEAAIYHIYKQTAEETSLEASVLGISDQSFEFLNKYPFHDPDEYIESQKLFFKLLQRNLRSIERSIRNFIINSIKHQEVED